MNLLLLLLSSGALAVTYPEYYYLTVGTFQHLCLGYNDNTAYVDNMCIIAKQEPGLSKTAAANNCKNDKPFGSDIVGELFKARDDDHVRAVEQRRVMNQSGAYRVESNGKGSDLAVPTSGKTDVIGYMCQYKDPMGCLSGSTRFRDKCYKAMPKAMTFDDAATACATEAGKLPIVEDDDLNQFLADFAADKFKGEKSRKMWLNGVPPHGEYGWSYEMKSGSEGDFPMTFFRWWFNSADGVNIKLGSFIVSNFERESCEEGIKFGYWTYESGDKPQLFVCETSTSSI